MHANDPIWADEDVVEVRDWLGDALLAGYAPLPATGDWPLAVLDGEPFPLEAAALGFAYVVAPGPSEYPEPVAFCSMDEQFRARRVAIEEDAAIFGYVPGEGDDEFA